MWTQSSRQILVSPSKPNLNDIGWALSGIMKRANRQKEGQINKAKVKVVPLLFFLTEHHAMKACGGSGGVAPRIFYLGTTWRWLVIFTLRPLYPRERDPSTHWIGGCVGPRVIPDAVVKKKIPSPRREWTSTMSSFYALQTGRVKTNFAQVEYYD